ncbi:MAG: 3-keto-disaccharide hydrolase [Planctomycetota bacterium]
MRTQCTTFTNVPLCPSFFPAPHLSRRGLCAMLFLGALVAGGCHESCPPAAPSEPAAAPAEPPTLPVEVPSEMSLFDGKTLGHWKITDFGGQGEVYVKDEAIYMEQGNDMTGITWAGPLVRMNYEITLEAMRVSGSDFFCGLTFPVNENHCSLILGGWGGTLCGLSNIDYYDAANNETTRIVSFENGQWYHVRLRVTPNRIQAWVEEEEDQLVDMDITDRKVDTRIEVDLSQPLGVATWQTAGAVRNIKLRRLEG